MTFPEEAAYWTDDADGDPIIAAPAGEVVGCPRCGTILNATAANCDDAWHHDNRPPPDMRSRRRGGRGAVATGGIITDPPPLFVDEGSSCTLTAPSTPVQRCTTSSQHDEHEWLWANAFRRQCPGVPAPANDPVPVPPPVDALQAVIEAARTYGRLAFADGRHGNDPEKSAAHWSAVKRATQALWAAGVEEGRRELDAEIHANVFTSARLAAAEAGFGMVPESVTVSYLTPDIRAVTLIEAYWKLRDHAAGLRDTEVYRKASERKEGTLGESPAFQRYRWLEATARGIEDGATDLAKLLGVDEFDIERPVNRG